MILNRKAVHILLIRIMRYVANVVKGMICPIRIAAWTSVVSMNFAEIVQTEFISKTDISSS